MYYFGGMADLVVDGLWLDCCCGLVFIWCWFSCCLAGIVICGL